MPVIDSVAARQDDFQIESRSGRSREKACIDPISGVSQVSQVALGQSVVMAQFMENRDPYLLAKYAVVVPPFGPFRRRQNAATEKVNHVG